MCGMQQLAAGFCGQRRGTATAPFPCTLCVLQKHVFNAKPQSLEFERGGWGAFRGRGGRAGGG